MTERFPTDFADPATFIGVWRLNRRMTDRRTGQIGCFHGVLTITDTMRWIEEGTLSWGDHHGPATRNLLLRKENGDWWVHFADGRPFHPWRIGAPVDHPCGEDRYRGLISLDHDRMRIRWDVLGPRKDLRIDSRLRRT